MNKNLIMFKSGEGVVEVYDTLYSFTQCIGHIYFQSAYKGVFIRWNSYYGVTQSPAILRDIADIMDELYKNEELLDQIGGI
jgi:uncharacterized membrane protein